MGVGLYGLSRSLRLFSSPIFLGVSMSLGFDISVIAKYGARVDLVCTLLGLSSFFDHYIKSSVQYIIFFLRSLY